MLFFIYSPPGLPQGEYPAASRHYSSCFAPSYVKHEPKLHPYTFSFLITPVNMFICTSLVNDSNLLNQGRPSEWTWGISWKHAINSIKAKLYNDSLTYCNAKNCNLAFASSHITYTSLQGGREGFFLRRVFRQNILWHHGIVVDVYNSRQPNNLKHTIYTVNTIFYFQFVCSQIAALH